MNLSKISTTAINIATPILVAAVLHKAATGKLDIKGAALDALAGALAARKVG